MIRRSIVTSTLNTSANPDTKQGDKLAPVPEDERVPLPNNASPLEVYNHRVEYHDLSYDSHQDEDVHRRMHLYDKLRTYRPAQPTMFS